MKPVIGAFLVCVALGQIFLIPSKDRDYRGGNGILSQSEPQFWMEPTGGDLSNLALGNDATAAESGTLALSTTPPVYHAGTVNAVKFDGSGAGSRITYPDSTLSNMNVNRSFWVAGAFRVPSTPANFGLCGNGGNSGSQAGFRVLLNGSSVTVSVGDGTTTATQSLTTVHGAFATDEWYGFVIEFLADADNDKVTVRFTINGVADYTLNSQAMKEFTGLTGLSSNPLSALAFTVGDTQPTKTLPFTGDIVLQAGNLGSSFLSPVELWYLNNYERSRIYADVRDKNQDPIKMLFAQPRSGGFDLSARCDQSVTFKALNASTRAVLDTAAATVNEGFAKASVTGLGDDTDVIVEAHFANGQVSAFEGHYKTPPATNNYTIAVLGCSKWSEEVFQNSAVVADIVADSDNPRFAMWAEDNGYIDLEVHFPSGATNADWRRRFDTIFNTTKAYYLFTRMPFIGGFGDHHFENDGDSSSQYMTVAREMARASSPNPESNFGDASDGWYYSVPINDLRFVVMDTSSGKIDGTQMINSTQTLWWEEEIQAAKVAGQIPINAWMNAIDFSPPSSPITNATWENFAQRTTLFDHIATQFGTSDKSMISVAGDVHSMAIDTGLNQGSFDTGGALRVPCILGGRLSHNASTSAGTWDTLLYLGDATWGKIKFYNDAAGTLDADLSGYQAETQQGSTLTQNLTKPANDPPALANLEVGDLAVTEPVSPTAVTDTITVSDTDDAYLYSATVAITSNAEVEDTLNFADTSEIEGTWNPVTYVLTLSGRDTVANYQAALRAVTYESSSQNAATPKTLSFTINDNGNDSNTVTRDISFTAVNNPPTLAAIESTTLTFNQGDAATAVTSTITVSDSDDTMIESATVQVTANYESSEDLLAYSGVGAIGAVWTSGSGLLTLSGTDTIANYQTALREVTFANSGSPPTETTRTITFTVNDGDDDSNTQTRDIMVTATDLQLTTGDGLDITFAADGEVTALADGANSVTLKSGQKGGFYVTDFEDTQTNYVSNGTFDDLTGWSQVNTPTIVTEGGRTFVRMDASDQITMAEFSLAPGRNYAIICDVRTAGGTSRIDMLDTTGGGWYQQSSGDISPTRGTNFNFKPGQNISDWETHSHIFYLHNDQDGIALNAKQLNAGQFDLDNLKIIDLDAIGGRLTQTYSAGSGEVTVSGSDATYDLDISATITQNADHLEISGTVVSDEAGTTDRAIMLSFNLPIDPSGWTWHGSYDAEDTEAFSAGNTYMYLESTPAINGDRDLLMSSQLCSAVQNGTVGLSVGHHCETIAQARYTLEDSGLWIKYIFGLSDDQKTANTQAFKFVLFAHEGGDWGMRRAASEYRSIVPSRFVDRDPIVNGVGHGASVFNIKGNPSVGGGGANGINFEGGDDPADWGARYEYRGWKDGATATKAEVDGGMIVLTHPNPSEWHVDGNPELTLAQMHSMLDTTKSGMATGTSYTWPVGIGGTGGTYAHRHGTSEFYETERQGMINSVFLNSAGEWTRFDFGTDLNFIGCCTHPSLPTPNVASLEREHFIDPELVKAVTTAGSVFHGIDADNMSFVPGRSKRNYNSAHFQYFDTPLSWDVATQELFSFNFMTYGEYLKNLAEEMHARTPTAIFTGNIGSSEANSLAYLWAHNAKFGGEFDFDNFNRRARVRTQRMMAGVKCVNQICNTSDAESNLDEIFSYCYLYASWPAIQGLNMTSQNTADFTAADATTLSAYLPLLRTLDNAGWEEIPYVSSTDSDIIIERFGTIADGDLHIVVHNQSAAQITGDVLTIDKTSLGIVGNTDWTDEWPTGGDQTDIDGTITVTVPAKRSIVFSVIAAGGGPTPTAYYARSTFSTADDNPLTSPHVGEAGSFTVSDVSSNAVISGGELQFPSGGAVWGDPSLVGTSHARALGSWLYTRFTINSYGNMIFGFDGAAAATNPTIMAGLYPRSTVLRYRTSSNVDIAPGLSTGTEYESLVSVEADGGQGHVMIKGGIYTDWTLLYRGGAGGGATLYPQIIGYNGNYDVSEIGAADPDTDTWLPTLAFAWANGANTTSTGLTGYTGGGSLSPTVHAGTVAIVSNRIESDTTTDTLVTWDTSNANFLYQFTVNSPSGAGNGIVFRYTDANNYWDSTVDITTGDYFIHETTAGTRVQRATIAASVSAATDATWAIRAVGDDIDLMANGSRVRVTDSSNNTATRAGIVTDSTSGVEFDDLHYFPSMQTAPEL